MHLLYFTFAFHRMHVKGLPLCIEHINASRLTHRGHVKLYETFQVLLDLNLSYTKFLFRLNVMRAFWTPSHILSSCMTLCGEGNCIKCMF